jgi:isoleucyl-tRNA synthetase
MKFPEYKSVSYPQIAEEILGFWKENGVFEDSIKLREGRPSFTFYEGPPSANGTPGIHHVMARTIKDIFCRYKTLQGFKVNRKGGWDTHGLPIELQVEKELGITKDDIGKKISVEDYNKKCREAVMRFTDLWESMTEQMGYWVDMKDPYITYKNNYVESLWSLLKKFYDKGLLYKGYTIQPFSPAAGTGLSSHELNQPGCYRNVKDTSVVAQFKAVYSEKSKFLFESEAEDVRFLAWTTTPWTLPGNCGLTVGANINYISVKTFNPYTFKPVTVILAEALLAKHFNEKAKDLALEDYKEGDKLIPFKVQKQFKGRDLLELRYEQLIPAVSNHTLDNNAFRVIAGDFVTTEDGTGIVHTASLFGADDFRVCQQNGVPSVMVTDETGKDVPVVDRQGKFVSQVGAWLVKNVEAAGIKTHKKIEADGFFVKNYLSEDEKAENYKNTDEMISIILKQNNLAFKVEKYEHSYPHCWRTDKPVLYYPLDSWFIRTTAMKDKLVELNKTINWAPESTGMGRFGNWLENLVDWNLSRSRYWGTPLPIWRSEDGEEVCIGSVKELIAAATHALKDEALSPEQKAANERFVAAYEKNKEQMAQEGREYERFDLHRPYVDEVYLVSVSGQLMTRETDLIDVWFDSGAMPYAQWHYPFENKEIFDDAYPADFISEGVDQTRGWFFTLHAIAGMLFESVAFKNVVSTGLVLDKNGNKMSKRLGNAVDPFETMNAFGADATRWYMITNAEPWDNLKFNIEGVQESQRKFFGTLTNTYNFFALYANLDQYKVEQWDRLPKEKLSESDRWIIAKIYKLSQEVAREFDAYNPTKAGRLIQDFVCDDLSNWYVRLNRRRFWQGELNDDKRAAYQTLQHALCAVAQFMSPIAPFYADWLYRNMTNAVREESKERNSPFKYESIHHSLWHSYEADWVDEDLLATMDQAQRICSLVHALRKKNSLKVRQPLSKVLIPVASETQKKQIEHVSALIQSEVNIKQIDFLTDDAEILKKKVKPNFKALGPKYGKDMKTVADLISGLSIEQLKSLESTGSLDLGGFKIESTDVEVLTEDIPGWLVASDRELTVALDINVTEELKQEGIARDFVNRIQNLRKDSGFEVTDKIKIQVLNTGDEQMAALGQFKAYINQEVQALSLDFVENLDNATALDMDGFELHVKVEKC